MNTYEEMLIHKIEESNYYLVQNFNPVPISNSLFSDSMEVKKTTFGRLSCEWNIFSLCIYTFLLSATTDQFFLELSLVKTCIFILEGFFLF